MRPVDPHLKLSLLWVFILLTILFRDLHQFVMPGFLDTIMTGRFNGMEITEELMLIGGLVVSVPSAMVPLSVLLEARLLKPVTYGAALITSVTMVPPAPVDLDDTYHFALQAAAMVAIIWTIWFWDHAAQAHERAAPKRRAVRSANPDAASRKA